VSGIWCRKIYKPKDLEEEREPKLLVCLIRTDWK